MRRVLPLIILALALALGSCSQREQQASFNLATYNLRVLNGGDTDAGNGWVNRCPVVAGLIRFHGFDIFGTQEGFKCQLEDLKQLLPGYDYIGVARDDGAEAGEHSAIFYRTSLFQLLDHGDFWLSETPDKPGLGWDAACVRICSWGKFRHLPSGKDFIYFNLHMDHVGVVAREQSVLLVQQKIKEIGGDMPTFVSGDFNVDQNSPSYRVMVESGTLGDSYERSEFVYATNGTFNAYAANGFTESRIDHIFVSNDVNVEKYGVLTDTYRTLRSDSVANAIDSSNFPKEVALDAYVARTPSDHFPVMIHVSF